MAALPKPGTKVTAAVWRAWEERAESWDGLGFSPSAVATECDRAIWLQFRWAPPREAFGGRQLRLFQTGHIEEDRIVAELISAGFEVDAVDPETGKQFSVRALAGHVRGKTDGRIRGVPEAPAKWHVLECKSHNDKSFKKLKAAGVGNLREGKFDHWVQVQIYLHLTGYDRALYSAVNKNDDDKWDDRVRYDHDFCARLFARLARIAEASHMPAAISDKQTAPDCRFCKGKAICAGESFARVTCRSCTHATALMHGDASWDCARFVKPLSWDEQRVACPNHLFLPDLVPGELTAVDEEREEITYRLADGRLWTDGRDTSPAPVTVETEQ
jgi:hypothetical protein